MNFGLYIIATNPTLSYGKVAEICVQNSVKYLQLREKDIPDKKLLEIALEMKSVTKGSQTKLVINDRPDIALLSDADALHLGQDDISMEQARKIVGQMPIGLSTHSIEQAQEALKLKPAYIGFGPIYQTTTKKNPDPTVGTQLLSAVLKFATVPVVAIGGIFPENVKDVVATGAKNLSLVRYLMESEQLEARIKEIQNLLSRQ